MEKKRRLHDAYSDEFLSTVESPGNSGSRDMNVSNYRDSSVTMKKRMKLNSTLPVDIVPLHKIPLAEKNKWLVKLKMDLEKVRTLQKKFDLHSAHALKNSSSRKHPPSQKGKVESANKGAFSLPLMKQCENLLKKLMTHRHGCMFNKPVDIVEFGIPDYYNVIKNPMDLGTIKEKLGSVKYSNPLEFLADVRLTFTNAMTYNPPGNKVHVMAVTLSKFFEQRWKAIEKKLPVNESQQEKVIEIDLAQEPVKLMMMTDEEKNNLSRDLEVHLDNLPDSIVDFIRKHASNGNEVEDEIEVDIDNFDNDSLLELRKMLDDHVQDRQNLREVEASVIDDIDESGISNSTLQSNKGNEVTDEDIDICGM